MTQPAIDPIDPVALAADPIELLLASTFGPTIAAEVAKEDKAAPAGGYSATLVEGSASPADAVDAHEVGATTSAGADVGASDLPSHSPAGAAESEVAALPRWWRYNLDGSPRKRVQAPKVYGDGSGSGEAKRLETDRAVLAALQSGAETLAQLVATTGFVKVTVVRSVERLEQSGRVVKGKADPTGRRGRRAFVFRPTTEPVVETTEEVEGG